MMGLETENLNAPVNYSGRRKAAADRDCQGNGKKMLIF